MSISLFQTGLHASLTSRFLNRMLCEAGLNFQSTLLCNFILLYQHASNLHVPLIFKGDEFVCVTVYWSTSAQEFLQK